MADTTQKACFKGIVAPIVSPCDEKDNLDMAALTGNFERLLKSPIDGMYLCGGTGDGENLSLEERKLITQMLAPELKRAGKCAIIHVGQTHQRHAVALCEHAAQVGADAVASIPPRAPQKETAAFYRALASADLPVFVYYIPAVTGKASPLEELCEILDIPGVAGIKMSDWNLFLLRQVKLLYPEKIVYSGYDELLALGLLSGADGSIGTWANLFPDMYAKAYRLAGEGRLNELTALQNKFTAFLALGWRFGIIDTFEELMAAKGYAKRCFRSPSSWYPGKVGEAALRELLSRMEDIDGFVASLP